MELLILHPGLEGALADYISSNGFVALDYSGKLLRTIPRLSIPAVDADDLDSALLDLINAMRTHRGICAYSLSALWALAYAGLGIRGSVTALTSFALRSNESSRAFGARLCMVVEEWFQRRNNYVYNIFKYTAKRITTVRGRPRRGPRGPADHSTLGAR